MPGRFISTHSMVLALPLHVDHLPERGAAVEAETAAARPGGGYVTLAAAAAQGVKASMAWPLGTGPNSYTVRQHLEEANVEILTTELVGDIGIAIQLVEADGSTTSVVTAGVESEPSRAALDRITLHDGDLVHISGVDLTNRIGAETLTGWGASLPENVTLVVSISPAVEEVPVSAWRRLLSRADVVTMNIREKAALDAILTRAEPGLSIRHIMRPHAAVVRRLGVMGCELQVNESAPRIHLPAFDAFTVDTSGVGDTHIATMCASLLKGASLEDACRAANAAAAFTIAHESALPVPTLADIEQILEQGGLVYSS